MASGGVAGIYKSWQILTNVSEQRIYFGFVDVVVV